MNVSNTLIFWRYVWILHKNANSAASTESKLKVRLIKMWSTYHFCKALAGTVENAFTTKKSFLFIYVHCVVLFIYVHCVVLASNRHTTISVSHIIDRTDKTKVSTQLFIQAIQHLLSKCGSSTDKTKPSLDITTFCFKASEREHRWRNLQP